MNKLYLLTPFIAGVAYEWRERKKLGTYFQHKTILITGGSTGLGFALAKRLLSYGANVSVCGRDEAKLEALRNRLVLYSNRLHVFLCDVASKEKVSHWMEAARERFGHVDILINNAGILTVGPVESQGESLYRESLDVMFWGHFNTTQEVLRFFEEDEGQIANIISVGGKISIPHMSSYSVAKAAASAYSEGLGVELARHGITVTSIYPWLLRTGSYVNGFFPRGDSREFRMFSLGSALPFLALNTEAAVTDILMAIRKKKTEAYIGSMAKIVTQVRNLLPGLSRRVLSLASGVLLSPPSTKDYVRGETMEESEFEIASFFGGHEREEFQHTRTS